MRPVLSRSLRLLVAAAALLGAAACAPSSAAPSAPRPADTLWARYRHAIHDASVYRPEHVRTLRPARAGADGWVRVATLAATGYALGDQTMTEDVWVTLVPEVRDSCRTFRDEDLLLRLRQQIGLPPDFAIDSMTEMAVRPRDLFRPAADPSIHTTRPCPDSVAPADCGGAFPPGATAAHEAWIARTTLLLWRDPGGFPWTRLGYTYNWHPGSPRYGASEYIVPQGAAVRVLSVTATEAYCGRTS